MILMKTANISVPLIGPPSFPTQQPTNELATERLLLLKTFAARVARYAVLPIAWLVVIPIFSPVIVLVWLSTKLHGLPGRALSDRSLTSLRHAELGVEAAAEARTSITPDQQAWIAEMEDFDRF